MTSETKYLFDQLTEDAVKLIRNGDYNVYQKKQKVVQREAEGYERLAQARGNGLLIQKLVVCLAMMKVLLILPLVYILATSQALSSILLIWQQLKVGAAFERCRKRERRTYVK